MWYPGCGAFREERRASLFPALGAAVFHVGAVGVGLLYAARGVGALIGSVVAGGLTITMNAQLAALCIAAIVITYDVLWWTLAESLRPIKSSPAN
ncbi:hypothetical protein ACFWWC_35530 [Streptomyces sp. NPDC058642]|uniref:hypothetical protein n=1 Tax=Streptomyces sp. NPDC058642 TaxID=3346572 RepID=UPI00366771FA